MTLKEFIEQVHSEHAKMFRKSECNITVESAGEGECVWISCAGNEKPGIGKVPCAQFWILLPSKCDGELPDKIELDISTECPNMNLRHTTGSAEKIIRMLHRNFDVMNRTQATM